MKIAITADAELPVPPALYGGIERIIDMLVSGLMTLGHEVTLFAHRDSNVRCRLVPYGAEGNKAADVVRNTWAVSKTIFGGGFDVLHSFGRLAYLSPLLPLRLPKLMSYQREPTIRQIKRAAGLSAHGSLRFTGCSDYITGQIKPYATAETVYNCIDPARYDLGMPAAGDAPLVFLGRIEPIKGAHTAITIAQKTGRKLVIAGNVPAQEQDYFNTRIRPFLNEQVTYTGPVDDRQKNELLKRGLALLMPIQWNEPFGIVMIEAMACGTPVIGFDRGAVREVVQHGVTGYYGNTMEELTEWVGQVHSLDRKLIRDITEAHFSAGVIVRQYEDLYYRMTRKK
ncbi:glycosyltransferase family 4 protein [Mucilaginibacter ginsenosidivorans]|uniref:Glycosyltransferase family 4 protein n=1 Tax=Mucilaginibacter ginsenosidivorans TaxID=398053 RepID=A0A5B8V4V9_9SPHI|nr:glycosyltransferase family 4 protein [Mucilaginibacter ginsenosidivorans]